MDDDKDPLRVLPEQALYHCQTQLYRYTWTVRDRDKKAGHRNGPHFLELNTYERKKEKFVPSWIITERTRMVATKRSFLADRESKVRSVL